MNKLSKPFKILLDAFFSSPKFEKGFGAGGLRKIKSKIWNIFDILKKYDKLSYNTSITLNSLLKTYSE